MSVAVLLRAVSYGGSGFVKGVVLAVVRNFYILLLLPHFSYLAVVEVQI